jgi:hypothetical protein
VELRVARRLRDLDQQLRVRPVQRVPRLQVQVRVQRDRRSLVPVLVLVPLVVQPRQARPVPLVLQSRRQASCHT